MSRSLIDRLAQRIDDGRRAGTHKNLCEIAGPIGGRVALAEGRQAYLLCSNDYLGLANHPVVRAGAHRAIDEFGASTASARFICGTMIVHRELEERLAEFLHVESALTFSSCWAANTGLLPAITGPGDVILSDELNHASIIDGCRMAHRDVVREVYKHADVADLERRLRTHAHAPARIVVSDGIFSMEGDAAPLADIVDLARRYDAIVVLDDSHGMGVVGATGKGLPEVYGVEGQVDILTGTLGKALGAGTGGFVAGPQAVIDTLVQFSRPHLFSNSLTPAVAGAGVAALDLLCKNPGMVAELCGKVEHFRSGLRAHGIEPLGGGAAIVAVIVGPTADAIRMSEQLRADGVFAVGFGFPVVPEGTARIRFQISNNHSIDDLDASIAVIARRWQATRSTAP
jgi:glycine C-acetyltransferase